MRLFLYKKVGKIITIIITFMFVFVWIFSGWPQINKFPPEVEKIYASTTDTYTSSTNWTCPAGVTSVIVEVWGSGGGGGSNDNNKDGSGAGGGGAYSRDNDVTVEAGDYTVTVGAIGAGNSSGGDGGDGGASWFINVGTVYAEGGFGGKAPVGTAGGIGGNGGALGNGVGADQKTSGGAGGDGYDSNSGVGGGGGGSGGTAVDGSAGATGAAGGAGATAVDGGGPGGDGGAILDPGLAPGSGPGGGGGGSGERVGGPGTFGTGGDGYVGQVSITYERLVIAPTQNDPANGLTDVSITPTFTMTTTDPDSDNLSYKVTIYSDACSTVVSTHDQAIVETGWANQNETCAAAPNSCYASGTQGNFTLQAGDALNNETQYYWRASAKDPDGAGTFVDSATCNNFTTIAAVAVSISIVNGSVAFGYIELGGAGSTTADGVDDVEVITVDIGPADLDARSTAWTEGGNTWALGSSNGNKVVLWEFSPDGSSWTTFAVANTEYELANSVAESATQDIYFRITMPTDTDTHEEYSTTVTIVATEPS